jgi:hypothetical protein
MESSAKEIKQNFGEFYCMQARDSLQSMTANVIAQTHMIFYVNDTRYSIDKKWSHGFNHLCKNASHVVHSITGYNFSQALRP